MFTLHIAGLCVDNIKGVIIYFFEKVSKREQMHTKTLYNLLVYIDADYQKDDFFTSAPVFYACRYSFATSTHVCCVLSIDFVKKSGIECCVWSAKCTESQARTSDNVKTWVFNSLLVQLWSFTDNVVYSDTLRSTKAAFLEIEKAMFTVTTAVRWVKWGDPVAHLLLCCQRKLILLCVPHFSQVTFSLR